MYLNVTELIILLTLYVWGFERIVKIITDYSPKQLQTIGLSNRDYVYCAVEIQDLYATNVHECHVSNDCT